MLTRLLQIIWAYDFDSAQGTLSNKRIFVDRREQAGEPDGLLVDVAGNVYTFLWGGGKVVKYNFRGEHLKEWSINAHRVTHGAWVGEQYDELVLTSAVTDDTSKLWDGEEGGALFWLKDVGCRGLRKNKFGNVQGL
jgi:sugar lactone lactonase YvrE